MTGSEGTALQILPCGEHQRAEVEALLEACGLPLAGLADHWHTTWVAIAGSGEVVGSVALELHGKAALLRSLAARADQRGLGLGSALFLHALDRARALGATSLSLLTTTAEPFFAARGFQPVSRDVLPKDLQASAEFRGACPASAAAMFRSLP
jgi:N-acetylglutamate synthase-like GNAT family acetyltransferase